MLTERKKDKPKKTQRRSDAPSHGVSLHSWPWKTSKHTEKFLTFGAWGNSATTSTSWGESKNASGSLFFAWKKATFPSLYSPKTKKDFFPHGNKISFCGAPVVCKEARLRRRCDCVRRTIEKKKKKIPLKKIVQIHTTKKKTTRRRRWEKKPNGAHYFFFFFCFVNSFFQFHFFSAFFFPSIHTPKENITPFPVNPSGIEPSSWIRMPGLVVSEKIFWQFFDACQILFRA